MENDTFCYVHGINIFCHISLLLHVLANIQNFDAHLRKSSFQQGPVTKMSPGLPASQPASQPASEPASQSASQPASQPASRPSKIDTIPFINSSQIHHFLVRSGQVPFWPVSLLFLLVLLMLLYVVLILLFSKLYSNASSTYAKHLGKQILMVCNDWASNEFWPPASFISFVTASHFILNLISIKKPVWGSRARVMYAFLDCLISYVSIYFSKS